MRNLKKALSMALALVMMLGMLTVASAAAGDAAKLADFASVENKEAVSLLVDLGIIAGITENGVTNYKPADSIDRNSFAKLVYFILMGNTSESNFKGIGNLKDVAGTWAEGFVNYLNSVKIVAGDDKQMYNGTNKVTVVQAAKMLLVALGYNAADRGYEMDVNWSVNIMKDAQNKGLMNGVIQTANQELTRDNAAQMVFNALMTTTVTPKYDRDMGEKYVSEYTNNATTLGLEVYGLVKLTAQLGEYGDKPSVTEVYPDNSTTSLKTVFGSAETDADDAYNFGVNMLGSLVTFYVKASPVLTNGVITNYTYKNLISSAPIAGSATVLGTSYGNTAWGDLTVKANGSSSFIAALNPTASGGVKYYKDGAELSGAAIAAVTDLFGTVAARGFVIECIDLDSDRDIDVVRITEKKYAVLTAAPVIEKDGDDTLITISAISGIDEVDINTVTGYEGLKKGDVVLYSFIDGSASGKDDLYAIELATVVEGKKTANSSTATAITFAGKSTNTSGLTGTAGTSSVVALTVNFGATITSNLQSVVDFTNTFALYLDNGGNAFAYKALTEDTANNVAIVLETAWVGGVSGSSNGAQAKLLFMDGTTEVIWVTKIGAETLVNDSAAGAAHYVVAFATVANKFVNFSINKTTGRYTLTLANNTAVAGAFTKGKAAIGTTTGSIATGNSSTVFVVNEGTAADPSYKVYTGIANAPSSTTLGTGALANVADGFAKYVYLPAASLSGSAGQYIYFNTLAFTEDGDGIRSYSAAYISGAVPTGGVKIDSTATGLSAVVRGSMYKVEKTSADGTVTELSAVVFNGANMPTSYVTAFGGDALVVAGANAGSYTYDTETKVFFIAADTANNRLSTISTKGTGDMKAYSATPTTGQYVVWFDVTAAGNADGYIATIYFIQVL